MDIGEEGTPLDVQKDLAEYIEENLGRVWRTDMIYGLDVSTLTEAILLAKENQVRL